MSTPASGVTRPGTNYVDGLIWGVRWDTGPSRSISYSFFDNPYLWYSYESRAVTTALRTWSNVADVTFSARSHDNTLADLRMEQFYASPRLLGFFVPPDPNEPHHGVGAFNWNGVGWSPSGLQKGGFGFTTIVHELGHALGLAHPHDHGGGSPTYAQLGIGNLDNGLFTVMSYNHAGERWNSSASGRANWTDFGQVATPMAFDIAAIQHIYGPNTRFHAGNTSYPLITHHYECIWDGGGVDTISAARAIVPVVIDLNPGTRLSRAAGVYGGYTIAYDADIENAIGGRSNDRLIGNALNNTLSGGHGADTLTGAAGNDRLIGGKGVDRMIGGSGDDLFVVDTARDVIREASNGGIDTVQAAFNYTLGSNIDTLILRGRAISGVGNNLDNSIIGDALKNVLVGKGGDDVLDGRAKADRMIGGPGDDTYHLDHAGDRVVEATNGGADTVVVRFSYTLGTSVENLVLAATAQSGFGNDFDNVITGNTADNVLDGRGGIDTMIGGLGDDTYHVDHQLDTIIEQPGGGLDLVVSGVSLTLAPEVDNLTLSGTGMIDGTGNDLVNALSGNAEKNSLNGGPGADLLFGNGGDDVLFGGQDADTLTGGSGADTLLYSSLSEAGDTVTDFATGAGGDRLDVQDVLSGFAEGTSVVPDFVRFVDSGTSTSCEIDANGGGDNFQALCTLDGVSGLILDNLIANGNLVVAG